MIDTRNAETLQGTIIYERPTPWVPFLLSLLRISKTTAFIDLENDETQHVFSLNKIVVSWVAWPHKRTPSEEDNLALFHASTPVFYRDKTLVVGENKHPVLRWSILTLFIFCMQSFLRGYIFSKWQRWI